MGGLIKLQLMSLNGGARCSSLVLTWRWYSIDGTNALRCDFFLWGAEMDFLAGSPIFSRYPSPHSYVDLYRSMENLSIDRTGGVDCAGDTVPRHSKGIFSRRPAPNYC
jgi:hypothetical protein